MALILGIDPGNKETAFVIYDTENKQIRAYGKSGNDEIRSALKITKGIDRAVIEKVACYGMPVGEEVFDTCIWTGRFIEQLGDMPYELMTRVEVKKRLCFKVVGINDSVIRQRLIDLFGGKETAIGKKKTPGPLYGVAGDCWAALAVVIASQHK